MHIAGIFWDDVYSLMMCVFSMRDSNFYSNPPSRGAHVIVTPKIEVDNGI